MNSKIKNVFQNVSYSVLANGINTLVSMVLVFIVPKALGVRSETLEAAAGSIPGRWNLSEVWRKEI